MRVSIGTAWLLMLGFVPNAGCVAVPVPMVDAPAPGSRRQPSDAVLENVRPGISTRRDILLELGQPDFSLSQHARFVYLFRYRNIGLAGLMIVPVWLLPIPYPLWTGLDSWNLFLLEFDPAGVLTRREMKPFGMFEFPNPLEEAGKW